MSTQRTLDHHPFAWAELPHNIHACLIYDSKHQRDSIVRQYLGAGLGHGEVVRYFTDVTPVEEVQAWLAQDGIAAEPSADGPFRFFKAESVYCPEGRFDPAKMVGGMVPGYERAREAGFSGVRSTGEMTWALRGIPGSDRLMEYESLLNTIVCSFPHHGMCQYDARQFDGATLFHVLRVHPYVVAGDQVVWNPYYAGPEVVLAGTGQTP